MPRIDSSILSDGKFKKTKVRSWDDNLVNTLKITNHDGDNKQTVPNQSVSKRKLKSNNNLSPELEDNPELEFNKGSGSNVEDNPELEFNKGSGGNVKDNPGLEFNKGSGGKVEDNPELEFNKGSSSNVKDNPGLEFNKGSGGKVEENLSQSPSFLDDDFRFKKIITRLSGHEKKILLAVLKICIKKDSMKTGSIPSEDFDNYLVINRNSRETAIKRLCKKGIIKRNSGKRGVRGTLNIAFVSELVMNISKDLYEQGELDILDRLE